MSRLPFLDDYSEGCHPRVLEVLAQGNLAAQPGYGADDHSGRARALLRTLMGQPDADVHFVSGGTQANLVVITSALRAHEAVIAAASGHIAHHEAGAIEATGHKVIAMPSADGKLRPADIEAALHEHALAPHVVRPRMVYVSNATEYGTVYRAAELEALSACCRTHGLWLFLDGARLPAALASPCNDLTLARLAELVDVFYLGGTKNGALLGEAVVVLAPALRDGFATVAKQRGALLAKGRVLGAQFEALLADGLFLQLASHANAQARAIAAGLEARGIPLLAPVETNQVFPVLPRARIEALRAHVAFHDWQGVDDDHAAIRFVASWATQDAAIAALMQAVDAA